MARILILVENLSVPFDRRVWQECRALAEAGHEVAVICPRGSKRDTEAYARIEGVEIHRYELEAATGGPAGYLKEYGTALWQTLRIARAARARASLRRHPGLQPAGPAVPDRAAVQAAAARASSSITTISCRSCSARASGRAAAAVGHRAARARDVPAGRPRHLDERELPPRRARRAVAWRPSGRRSCAARPTSRASSRSRPTTRCGAAAAPRLLPRRDGAAGRRRLCAALARAPARRPRAHDVQAAFLGHGDAWDELVALAHELGLDDRVEFTGRVSDEDVRATSRRPTSASRPIRRIRSTTSRR